MNTYEVILIEMLETQKANCYLFKIKYPFLVAY